jgi:hypothetical protein
LKRNKEKINRLISKTEKVRKNEKRKEKEQTKWTRTETEPEGKE